MGVYDSIIDGVNAFVTGFSNVLPAGSQMLVGLTLYTIFIVLYSVFIWKFYKFLSKRNIIELNLKQYNSSKNPGFEKFLAVVLDIVEYIIILPFMILFWFFVLAVFLLVLSKSQSVGQILLIAAAIIAATRITSYISEELSKDIAKIFPFTILVLFLLDPDFFQIVGLFEKVREIPLLFGSIFAFLGFIFIVELILRSLYVFVEFIYSRDTEDTEDIDTSGEDS